MNARDQGSWELDDDYSPPNTQPKADLRRVDRSPTWPPRIPKSPRSSEERRAIVTLIWVFGWLPAWILLYWHYSHDIGFSIGAGFAVWFACLLGWATKS